MAGNHTSTPIILSDTAQWFCSVIKPNRMLRAEYDLARLGYRCFYPKRRKWVSHARTKKAKEEPILGRYLFVEVDQPRQSFATIRNVFEVESMVSNCGSPIAFPSHWVEGLLTRYLAGEWDEIAKGPVPVGARVKIVEGEFEGQLATVTRVKAHRVDLRPVGMSRDIRISEVSVRAA
jgi:transcription antitermination factor NusG